MAHDAKVLEVEAARLLKTAADSDDGTIMMLRRMGGLRIQAGGQQMIPAGANARVIARWIAAVEALEDLGLIDATSYRREMFRVTDAGYEAADQIDLSSLDPE